jgi:hypothetical protein
MMQLVDGVANPRDFGVGGRVYGIVCYAFCTAGDFYLDAVVSSEVVRLNQRR